MTDFSLFALWVALALAAIGAVRLDLLQLLWRESMRLFASAAPPGRLDDAATALPEPQLPEAPAQHSKHRPAFHRSGRRT